MTYVPQLSREAGDFTWLIADFVRTVHGAADAVAVSSDGLLLAASEALDRDGAERLAAVVSGICSLAQGAAHTHARIGGGVKLVMVEMYRGFLLLSSVRDGSCLGVLAEPESDIGLVGYEMGVLADRIGGILTPRLVTELQSAAART